MCTTKLAIVSSFFLLLLNVLTGSALKVCLVNPLPWKQSTVLSTLSQNYNTQSFWKGATFKTLTEAMQDTTSFDLIIITGSSGQKGVKDEKTKKFVDWKDIKITLKGPKVFETCMCSPVIMAINDDVVFCHTGVVVPRHLDNKYSILTYPSINHNMAISNDDDAYNCFLNTKPKQKKMHPVAFEEQFKGKIKFSEKCPLFQKAHPDDSDDALFKRIIDEVVLRYTPLTLDRIFTSMLSMNLKSEVFTSDIFKQITAIKEFVITDFSFPLHSVDISSRLVQNGVIKPSKLKLVNHLCIIKPQDIFNAPLISPDLVFIE